jgi:transposase InsO family protein
VTFIDDYSRRTWIFFMKTKDEVFSRFKEFRALVENQTGKKIKDLNSDNGGGYTSNEFRNFCKEVGIKKEMTLPFKPQQNGVVERKNQTIVEVANAMLHDRNLHMLLWVEACNTTMYVQNMSPRRILEDKTLEEAFIGVRLEIGHLRIFGCYPLVALGRIDDDLQRLNKSIVQNQSSEVQPSLMTPLIFLLLLHT